MKFVKQHISLIERLRWLLHGIEWLPLTYIPCHDYDTKKWRMERITFQERFDCFLAGLETSIIGYVYGTE